MPHTPEDFLGNMDDNMDEDIMPSLQLGEEFPTVILDDDVQSLINNTPTTKPGSGLVWL